MRSYCTAQGTLQCVLSEGLTSAKGATHRMAHSQGYWQEVPCHMNLSIGLLEYPLNVATRLAQSKIIQNRARWKPQCLQIQKSHSIISHYPTGYKGHPSQYERKLHKDMNARRWVSVDDIWEGQLPQLDNIILCLFYR